jgi:4-hydroxy-tetrahydrodipicolinate synthase
MTQTKFTGTGVAIVTPFRTDKSIDFNSLKKLVDHLILNGVDYLVVLGTTGESVTLTKDEKHAVVDFVIETVNKRMPVVVGMGGNNTQEVINVINTFSFDGIDAILSVAPYYNKPSQEGIFQHFKAIASASPKPVILYNVPGRTGSNISAETTVKLAKEIKNIVAIKEASGNFSQLMQIIQNKPKEFDVISGDDAITLPMISIGGSGVISVVANAYPSQFSEMVKLALNSDFKKAAEIHYRLFEMIQALFEEGNPSGIKAVLKIINICENSVRLPLVQVSDKLFKKLEILAKAIK